MSWGKDKISLYDQLDSVPPDLILGVINWVCVNIGVNVVVVDSLMKCGIRVDDYSGQMEFLDKLAWAAKMHEAHIFLVTHVRKGNDEKSVPSKWDIFGASQISNIPDNILITHRNLKKEGSAEKLKYQRNDMSADEIDRHEKIVAREPDQFLKVAKQRYGSYEGTIGLRFHDDSLQFTESGKRMPFEVKADVVEYVPGATG